MCTAITSCCDLCSTSPKCSRTEVQTGRWILFLSSPHIPLVFLRELNLVNLLWLFCGEGMYRCDGYGRRLLGCVRDPEATVHLLSWFPEDAEGLS